LKRLALFLGMVCPGLLLAAVCGKQEESAESQKPKAQTAATADRMARMSAVVRESNVYRWVGDLIAALARPRPSDGAE
jgi:hypothetical protein